MLLASVASIAESLRSGRAGVTLMASLPAPDRYRAATVTERVSRGSGTGHAAGVGALRRRWVLAIETWWGRRPRRLRQCGSGGPARTGGSAPQRAQKAKEGGPKPALFHLSDVSRESSDPATRQTDRYGSDQIRGVSDEPRTAYPVRCLRSSCPGTDCPEELRTQHHGNTGRWSWQ